MKKYSARVLHVNLLRNAGLDPVLSTNTYFLMRSQFIGDLQRALIMASPRVRWVRKDGQLYLWVDLSVPPCSFLPSSHATVPSTVPRMLRKYGFIKKGNLWYHHCIQIPTDIIRCVHMKRAQRKRPPTRVQPTPFAH